MHPDHRSISELAYQLWQARGCPGGTAEHDWVEAERQLANQARLDETPPALASAPPPPTITPSGGRPTRTRTLESKSVPLNPSSDRPG
jgi:LmbE family N-acetylglucosaminyl deacetylase